MAAGIIAWRSVRGCMAGNSTAQYRRGALSLALLRSIHPSAPKLAWRGAAAAIGAGMAGNGGVIRWPRQRLQRKLLAARISAAMAASAAGALRRLMLHENQLRVTISCARLSTLHG